MDKEIKKLFKKVIGACFNLIPSDTVFGWFDGDEKGVPADRIFIGRRGAPRPDMTLTPAEIKAVECTKPGLLKPGLLTVVGVEGNVLATFQFKDKANLKEAAKFNECLALYKEHILGK